MNFPSKKIFIIISVLTLFASNSIALADFSDVTSTSDHYIAIQYFGSQNIFPANQDGLFHPENFLTVAEGIKIILSANSIAPSTPTANVFADVAPTDPYANYIQKAKELGIITGDGQNNIHPTDNMSRAQFTKTLLSLIGFNTAITQNKQLYRDVPAQAWFAPYMNFAGQTGIFIPDNDSDLYPSQPIDRGEAAEALYVITLMKQRNNLSFLLTQVQSQMSEVNVYLNNNNFAAADRTSAYADSLGQEVYRLSSTTNSVVGKAKLARAYRNLVKAFIAKKTNRPNDEKNYANLAITKSNEAITVDNSDQSAAQTIETLAVPLDTASSGN